MGQVIFFQQQQQHLKELIQVMNWEMHGSVLNCGLLHWVKKTVLNLNDAWFQLCWGDKTHSQGQSLGKTVGINPSRQRTELEGTSSTDLLEPRVQVSSFNQTFSKARTSPGWIFSFERWFVGIKTGKEKILSVICFPRVERRNPALSQGKHWDDSADKNMGIFVALLTHCFVKG